MNCKYYKQKKQVSYDNGVTWYDLSEYRTGSLYESGGTDCNQYTPIYRWVNTTGYMCNGTSKYARMKKQVSNDNGATYADVVPAEYMAGSVIEYQSVDCGYVPEPIYRWTNMPISLDSYCISGDKFYKQKKEISYNNGITWIDVIPYEYQVGDLYESDSQDCPDVSGENFSGQYLTFESLSDGNVISFVSRDPASSKGSSEIRRVQISLDSGETWSDYIYSSSGDGTILATLDFGEKLLLKGLNFNFFRPYNDSIAFVTTGQFFVYGNLMSIISGDTFENAIFQTYIHQGDIINTASIFSGCTGLISAKNLVVSRNTISGCYEYMFASCENLQVAPKLPVRYLSDDCYMQMFKGCTKLKIAPELPATTLVKHCYYRMFEGCTNLNYVKAMFTTDPHTSGLERFQYTQWWLKNVSQTGTFVKNTNATWNLSGDSGIPDGWTVQNA